MIKVFPSQAVSHSYLLASVKDKPKSAVFSSSFISWDTFKDSCTTLPDLKEANYVDRRVFAEEFFLRHNDLKYFNFKDYPCSENAFVKELSDNIVHYYKALKNYSYLPNDLSHDMNIALKEYQEFLKEHNKYEKSYLEPDFSKAEKDTVIYFASAIGDTDIHKALKYCKAVEFDSSLPPLNVFENSICEISFTMREIRKLLQSGVKASDIALTCVNLKDSLPYIKQESYKQNIKLDISLGQNLSDYNPGRFFFELNDVCENNYSFSSLKRFLLNPAYPFSKRETINALIRDSINLKIEDGNYACSNYKHKFEQAEKLESLTYITKFSEIASSIVYAKTTDDLKLALRRFQDEFFEGASWDSSKNENESKIFERCIGSIDLLKDSSYSGKKPYRAFLDILSKTIYTLQNNKSDVKVYDYPVSCGLKSKYHFVIGLSDEDTRRKRSDAPFIRDNSFDEDITDNIIKSYCYDNKNIVLSCSNKTFSGSVSSSSLFARYNKTVKKESDFADEYYQEQENWKNCENTGQASQKIVELFNKAKGLSVTASRKEDISFEVPQKIKMSATALETYRTCPYKWYCIYVLDLKEEDYDPVMENHLEIGNILHASYEEYLGKMKSFDSSNGNTDLLRQIFESKLKAYYHSCYGMDYLTYLKVKNDYSESLSSLFTASGYNLFEGSQVVSLEQHFELEDDTYKSEGSIDCVLKTPAGDYAIIDFKKNNVSSDSLQIALYSKALSNENKTVVLGSFYSIGKQKYFFSFKSQDEKEKSLFELENTIKQAVKDIKSNSISKTNDSKSCQECPYRRICRRRYVIK